jgi:hypothetical protein
MAEAPEVRDWSTDIAAIEQLPSGFRAIFYRPGGRASGGSAA